MVARLLHRTTRRLSIIEVRRAYLVHVQEGVDVAVRIAPLADSTLIARPVTKVRQVIVASPMALRWLGIPGEPLELRKLPWVLHGGLGDLGTREFQVDGRPLRIALGLDSLRIANYELSGLDGAGSEKT